MAEPRDRMGIIAELAIVLEGTVQRGDDRASDALRAGIALIVRDTGIVEHDEQRRQRDAARKPKIPRNSRKSTDSVEFQDTPSGSLGLFPNPKLTTAPQPTAREASEKDDATEAVIARLVRVWPAETWAAADAFLQRRSYRTWKSWLAQMEGNTGPGSQYTLADLEAVCRDDGALERQIGSPSGLRGFLARAAMERRGPRPDSPPSTGVRAPRGSAGVSPGAQQFANIMGGKS